MKHSIFVRNLNSEFSFMRAIILQSYINKANTWIIQIDYKSCKYSTSEIQRRPSDRPTTFCMKFELNEFEPNEINFILNSARIIPGRNVFNCQFTSSMYSGVQRAVQIEQWCISCGMYIVHYYNHKVTTELFPFLDECDQWNCSLDQIRL